MEWSNDGRLLVVKWSDQTDLMDPLVDAPLQRPSGASSPALAGTAEFTNCTHVY